MKSVKLLSLALTGALALGALSGCAGQTTNETASSSSASSAAQATASSGVEAEASQLMADITGEYSELFPVLFDSKYDELWLDDTASVVGQEKAAESVDMLKSSVGGELYGDEAIAAYGENGGSFYCGWIGDLSELSIDGDEAVISGKDTGGNELFSHTYRFVDMDGNFFVFESEDGNEDEYRYFAFLPDTPDTTHHIEFRYGSTLDGIGEMMAGPYAFWMAAGIQNDYTEQTVADAIKLFCDENLAG